MQFRRRPVVIEAKQWWPPGDPRHDPAMLSHRKGNTVSPGDYRQVGDLYQFSEIRGMGDDIFLLKLDGDGRMRVMPGDWIVATGGRSWVVEADKFHELYEAV